MLTLARLALRDLAHQRAFALFFVANLALGLSGALLLDALQGSVERTLADRSRTMLGADVRIVSPRPFAAEELAAFDSAAGAAATSDLLQTYSMVVGRGRARLVELRGIDRNYPLAGALALKNAGVVTRADHADLERGAQAWADPALLDQLGVSLNDTVRIGTSEFRITDTLTRDTGISIRATSLAPRLYIALSRVDGTGLVQTGSRVEVQHLVVLAGDGKDPGSSPTEATSADAAAERVRTLVSDARIRVASHGEAAAEVSGAYTRVTRYLGLISLCALALAAVACAYLFQVFLRRRLADLAILRSLGARRSRAERLLLSELAILAFSSAALACVLVSMALPGAARIFAEVLPGELRLGVGWREAAAAFLIAMVVGPVSCLPLLARLRSMRVAELFQEHVSLQLPSRRFEVLWYLPAIAAFLALAMWRSQSITQGAAFVGGIAAAFALTTGFARVLLPLIARLGEHSRVSVRLALRQLAPHRRGSVTAFVALALAALLLGLPPQLRALLASQLETPAEAAIPSLFLFDIQPEQAQPLIDHIRDSGSVLQRVAPMVRARLLAVNERQIAAEEAKPNERGLRDAERLGSRTYNLTYQRQLHSTETIVAGQEFSGEWDEASGKPAEISVEIDFAHRLGLALGDTLSFDVQGVPVEGRIVNLREVDWTSLQPNFFVSFQPGVLEAAPSVFLASVPSLPPEQRELLQASIVEAFPNVSMIDVSRGVERALGLLKQLQWAVSATAWTALAVGLALIFAIARDEADQRRWDLNLAKVLGARHSLLRTSIAVEFATLGLSAAVVGSILAAIGCGLLARGLLDTRAVFAWQPLLGVVAALPLLTAVTARVAMRKVLRERPLISLR